MLTLRSKDAYVPGKYPLSDMETLADRIRQLRVARGLTQREIASYCGVSRPAVTQWENGNTANIKLEAFLRLCEILHTDVNFLVYGPDRGRGPAHVRKPGTGSH